MANNSGIEIKAFPLDGYIGLEIPKAALPDVPGVQSYLIRFKSPDGFKEFMMAAMDAARQTWPEIEKLWNEV